MKKILVTGGSGFIGGPTLRRLVARGYEVHAVSRRESRRANDVFWHTADVLDVSATESVVRSVKADHLLHMAWVTDQGECWTAPSNTEWFAASRNLLEAFGRSGGQRAITLGSCAEYNWTGTERLREATQLGPASPYGAAKASLGWIQQQLASRLGFRQAWCRPFFLYGPGENPARLVPSLARAILQGEPPICRHPEAVRDFLHVDDVAEAIATVVDSEHEGAVNIASGEGVALGSIARLLSGLVDPPSPMQLVADETDRVVGDTAVLKALGFRPRYSLRSGLAETLEWWQDHLLPRVQAR